MLKERLLSKDFYLDSMSMFLKNSFGMIDREETYRAVLNNVNGFADSLISRYDLFNILFKEDYFERNGIDKDGDEDAVLDNIAAIFGLNRSMNVSYYGIGYANQYYGERGVLYTESIRLTNRELYIYIKIAITKLNFQGTAGEIKDLYYPTDEKDDNDDIKQLGIYYSWGGGSSSRLPEGYTELTYIQSSGTQYIDTGYTAKTNSGISMTYAYTASGNAGISGIYTPDSPRKDTLFITTQSGQTATAILLCSQGTNVASDIIPVLNTFYNAKINYLNDNKLVLNDTEIGTQGTNGVDTSSTIILFGRYYSGGTNSYTSARISHCAITEGTSIVHDFVPAMRNNDSAVGMYDLVTNAFFGNAGTGSFIAGTPVQPTTGSPLVCNVWLCSIEEISKNNFNSNIIKLFLADELLVESLGIQYIKSLGMSTFIARFDVADIPDVENYVYVFDPNFNNQAQETFKYAVFQ